MDLWLVLLLVLASAYATAMLLLAIGLCRAAKRGDEPCLALVSGRR